ncbi:MAG: sugar phosphate nucleotidyltransferase, partial [Thermodesulfobacteriota bacterium]
TSKYGIIDKDEVVDGVCRVKGLVEKPEPDKAPSNLAVIGRYILMPRIFEILGKHKVGAGGEIQLTDAMAELLTEQPIFAFNFDGIRFDCGSKIGFAMANIAFALERQDLRDDFLPFLKEMLRNYE